MPNNSSYELYKAAEIGNASAIKKLIKNKVPFDVRFDEKGNENAALGRDALYIAAKNGRTNVVELLLKAGAKADLTYLDRQVSALHAAAHSGHVDVVRLLIKYGANVNHKSNDDATPLDAAAPSVIDVLIKAGAVKRIDKRQFNLIENYNHFVDEVNKNNKTKFKKINESGLCDGLSKLFIFYTKQNRIDEFNFFIEFINSLNKSDIERLAKQYQDNSNFRVKLAADDTRSYPFEKLISFIKATQAAYEKQATTKYKSIGANWDSSSLLACQPSELASCLKECDVMNVDSENNSVRFKYISIPKHGMALCVSKDGASFYDPNNEHGAVICRNEEELAEAMLSSLPENYTTIFCIDDISYGDHNRFIDDWLAENADILEKGDNLKIYIENYRRGTISRADLAYCLHQQMLAMSPGTPSYNKLKNELEMYLSNNPSKSIISSSLIDMNMAVDGIGTNMLNFACKHAVLRSIQPLIDRGSGINHVAAYDLNPLHEAVLFNHLGMTLFLISRGADVNFADKKGDTPLHVAIQMDNVEIVSLLLASGANANAPDNNGVTPLHEALLSGSTQVTQLVELLIKYEANIDVSTTEGLTPIAIAKHMGYQDVVNMLQSVKNQKLPRQDLGVTLDEIAKKAIEYANKKINASTTSLDFNEQTKEQQEALESALNATRMRGRSSDRQINIKSNFDRLDMDSTLFQFYHAIEGAVESGKGNCGELTALALEYVAEHYPDVRAEMYGIEGGDHIILILGRNENSNENDPLKWGKAIICDPLYKNFYPANEYLTKLKNFRYETIDDKTINALEDFDIAKHHLQKLEGFDSATINSFNSNENIEEMKTYFKVKLAFIEQLLQVFLDQISKQECENSVALNDKIKSIHILLDKIKEPDELIKKLIENKTVFTYKAIRDVLKNELQNEIINKFLLILEVPQKQMLGATLFSKQYNLESLKTLDDASNYVKDIFDNIIACDRDMSAVLSIQRDASKAVIENEIKRGMLISMQQLNVIHRALK